MSNNKRIQCSHCHSPGLVPGRNQSEKYKTQYPGQTELKTGGTSITKSPQDRGDPISLCCPSGALLHLKQQLWECHQTSPGNRSLPSWFHGVPGQGASPKIHGVCSGLFLLRVESIVSVLPNKPCPLTSALCRGRGPSLS